MEQTTAECDELIANESHSCIDIPHDPEATDPHHTEYHLMEIDKVCKIFKVDPDKGLNYNEIQKRRKKYGSNKMTPPQQSKLPMIKRKIFTTEMCVGYTVSLILCIVTSVMLENIWIIILSVILFTTMTLSCLWSFYGGNNLITKCIYNPTSDPFSNYTVTVIRDNNLISGYWRQTMNKTAVEDIVYIIKEYYRMYFIIIFYSS